MATLLRNVLITSPECGVGNKAEIDNRTSDQIDTGIFNSIRSHIADLDGAITASPDVKIKTIKKATSFPIVDIQAIINSSPGCTYLRVYNGFDSNGVFVTYLGPVSDNFETYLKADLSDSSLISKSCCHCQPCTSDSLLNI